MPKAIAQANTFLKAKVLGAQDLKNSEKSYVPEGHIFYVSRFAPDKNQHTFMTLASPNIADIPPDCTSTERHR